MNTAISYFLYLTFVTFFSETYYVGFWALSSLITTVIAFNLYRRFVFVPQGSWPQEYLKFLSKDAVSFCIKIAMLPLLVNTLGISVKLAPLIVIGVQVMFTYFYQKKSYFRIYLIGFEPIRGMPDY